LTHSHFGLSLKRLSGLWVYWAVPLSPRECLLMTNLDGRDSNLAGLRLLVVDDNRDAADALVIMLGLWGHYPRVAYDADGALTDALAEPPEAVLLDLGLPRRDGFALAVDLRANPTTRLAAVVAITGHGDQPCRERAAAAGFAGYLVKPADPEVLQRLLGDLLGK
jgi:CheY-like chemotaxis protein